MLTLVAAAVISILLLLQLHKRMHVQVAASPDVAPGGDLSPSALPLSRRLEVLLPPARLPPSPLPPALPPSIWSRYLLGDVGQACTGACGAVDLSCSRFPGGGTQSEVAAAMASLGKPCTYFGGWGRGSFSPWVRGKQCYWDFNSDSECDTPLAFTTLGVRLGNGAAKESSDAATAVGPRRLCWCENRSSSLQVPLVPR